MKFLKEKNAKKQEKIESQIKELDPENQQLWPQIQSSEESPLPLDTETLVEKITITVLQTILDFCKDSEANLKAHNENLEEINREIESAISDIFSI